MGIRCKEQERTDMQENDNLHFCLAVSTSATGVHISKMRGCRGKEMQMIIAGEHARLFIPRFLA